jgi:hypothetical protein
MIDLLYFVLGGVVAVAGVVVLQRVRSGVLRSLLVAGALAICLTPTVVAGGHGAGWAPAWYAIVYYLSYDPLPLEDLLVLGILPPAVVWVIFLGVAGLIALIKRVRRRGRAPAPGGMSANSQ